MAIDMNTIDNFETNVIQQLADNPNESGLDANDLKEKFDAGADNIKQYLKTDFKGEINTELSRIESSILSKVYPVGSLYMSVNNVSPQDFIGGTWERIEDRFLLSAGSTYTAGSTGGAATVTLTTDQIPAHTHIASGYRASFADAGNDRNTPVSWNSSYRDGQYTSSSTGGGQAHNNMPPYLAVYVWKRIS